MNLKAGRIYETKGIMKNLKAESESLILGDLLIQRKSPLKNTGKVANRSNSVQVCESTSVRRFE